MTGARPARPGLVARLRGRPDSEHEMGLNRIVLGSAILAYALGIGAPPTNVAVLIAYTLLGIAVVIHIAADDRVVPLRRFAVILLDVTALGHLMHANGSAGAAFYPLYLWLTLGNGFRFGVRDLWIAVLASMTSFALVWATTPFWRELPTLATGLMVGLIALPAYAATLIRKLSAATAAAEDASRAKSYFLASVSHELRTPLTAIIGLGAHLAETGDEAENRAMAGTIVSAGRQLLTMINRLLDYSRFEAQGGVVEATAFDLAELLISVRDLMQGQAQEKGLTLNIHLAAPTPIALRGDEGHLRDILVNLVGNALKFTDAGAITVAASVDVEPGGAPRLQLSVDDTGIGIAEEAQDHIFGSFRQADATIIDRYGGTGLGLAICKQLVAMMGGEIGVDSRPGEGSRFRLSVPIAIEPEAVLAQGDPPRLLLYSADAVLADAIGRGVVRCDTREAIRALSDPSYPTVVLVDQRLLAAEPGGGRMLADVAAAVARGVIPVLLSDPAGSRHDRRTLERGMILSLPRQPAGDALDRALTVATRLAGCTVRPRAKPVVVAPRRILVADDNAMNRQVLGMILGRAGHAVTCAGDGEQALDRMRDDEFDVVLMDVNMPVLNGIDATRLYRFAALGQRRVPIVAATADASPETAERCLEAGMDACIAKPIEADALLRLIETLTMEREAAAVPVFDPAGVVTPLFRSADTSVDDATIDWSSLDELEELGGREFVGDLLKVYTDDVTGLLAAVTAAVAAGDVIAFRDNAHALRSSAANVGATRVAEMCLHYQRIGESEFFERGARHRDRLAAELGRVATALSGWPSRAADERARAG